MGLVSLLGIKANAYLIKGLVLGRLSYMSLLNENCFKLLLWILLIWLLCAILAVFELISHSDFALGTIGLILFMGFVILLVLLKIIFPFPKSNEESDLDPDLDPDFAIGTIGLTFFAVGLLLLLMKSRFLKSNEE